ncbi:hypothetical protein [Sphingobium algorifonticola]|nr:hypothetical protein [Sphingobium algorifonticola]
MTGDVMRQGAVEVGVRRTPPEWAVLQRRLIDMMSEAALDFADRYTRPDGTLIWRDDWPGMDGSDDPYEGFRNMPLLYAIGGADALLPRARLIWDGITWQWTQYGQIRDEFDRSYDWMHHGEAYLFSYFMGLADPESLKERQRAVRFADIYVRNATTDPVFDRATGHMRAPITGSDGPHFVHTAEDWSTHVPILAEYLPPFEDLPGIDAHQKTCPWDDPDVLAAILERINVRQARGDVPINLLVTSMAVHAASFTQDDAYRDWALAYLENWERRCAENGGIIPDNVGPSGTIGELNDGKWWGGFYGWRWPHGAFAILEALCVSGANAALLTGDMSKLDLARSQIDMLWHAGRDENGQWVTPVRRYDDGWRDFRPFDPMYGVHLWNVSMDPADAKRAERAWSGHYDEVDTSYGTYRRTNGGHVGFNGNSAQWFRFIRGGNPDYPERILRANLAMMQDQIERYRSDAFDPHTMDHRTDPMAIHCWQFLMPVIVEGLAQLTMGGPMHIYHGGLQHVRLRYFDPVRRRPGLPPTLSALVHDASPTSVTVTLVNLDDQHVSEVVIQGGGFGEHHIVRMDADTESGTITRDVGASHATLTIAAGATVTVKLTVERYAAPPSYMAPWQREWPPLLKGRSL